MQINTSLSALENLIAQILEDNVGKTLTASQFTIGNPSAFTAEGNPNNSQVTLTAVAGEGKTGSATFNYTRLALTTGVASLPAKVDVAGTDTQAQALTKVAAAYGLVEAELDASAYTAPLNASTDGSITITPKANSLLYVGSPVVVTLNYFEDSLASFTTQLGGFDAVV